MSTASSPSAGPAKSGRTRNAQAQADLRVRRKAYIKTLEDTVSSLEAYIRHLRAQNDALSSRLDTLPSSSGSPSNEVDVLREENKKLHTLLAEAGLAAAAATKLAKMGKDSSIDAPAKKVERATSTPITSMNATHEEKSWCDTSSITTKKRKLSKMQAYAKDIDLQLNTGSAATAAVPDEAAVMQAHAVFDAAVASLLEQYGAKSNTTTTSNTPVSSRESVVSHRSPTTPRFEPLPQTMPIAISKPDPLDAASLNLNQVEPSLPNPPTLQSYAQSQLPMAVPTYDLSNWLTSTQTPYPIPAAEFVPSWLDTQRSSASISVA